MATTAAAAAAAGVGPSSSDDLGASMESDEPITPTDWEGSFVQEGYGRGIDTDVWEDDELWEYAKSLGMNREIDTDLLWLAREAFTAPLPAGWSEYIDAEGRVYFCNNETQESRWTHPMDAVFQELVGIVKSLREKRPPIPEARCAEAIQEHLEAAHKKALAQLECWSGPYMSDAGSYYFNHVRNVSTWENPVEAWDAELATRERVLQHCLLLNRGTSSTLRSPTSDGGAPVSLLEKASAGGAGAATPPQWRPLANFGLSAPRADDNVSPPNSARSFHTAYSARSVISARSGVSSRCQSRCNPDRVAKPSKSPVRARAAAMLGPSSPASSSTTAPKAEADAAAEEAPADGAALAFKPPPRSPPRLPGSPDARGGKKVTALEALAASSAGDGGGQGTDGADRGPETPREDAADGAAGTEQQAAEATEATEDAKDAKDAKVGGSSDKTKVDGGPGRLENDAGTPPELCTSPASQGVTTPDAGTASTKTAAASGGFDLETEITVFAGDTSRNSLELPVSMSVEQRTRARALVGKHPGLRCESFGFGAERRLHVFRERASDRGAGAAQASGSGDTGAGGAQAGGPAPDARVATPESSVDYLEFSFGSGALKMPKFST